MDVGVSSNTLYSPQPFFLVKIVGRIVSTWTTRITTGHTIWQSMTRN